jgi:hypothetical protein
VFNKYKSMKKIILLAVFCFGITASFAQKRTKKVLKSSSNDSKIEVAIVGGFDIQKGINNLSRNYASTNLYAGYFINPKTEIGLRASKAFISEASNYGFGIFGRRYFKKFYGGLGINLTNFTIPKTDNFGNEYKTYQSIKSIGLESGYRFAISNNVMVETGINIEMSLNKETKIDKTAYGIRAGIVYGF